MTKLLHLLSQWFKPPLASHRREEANAYVNRAEAEAVLDLGRVGWLGTFGVLVYAPTNHWWFAFQERYVTAFKSRYYPKIKSKNIMVYYSVSP